jgi:methionyl aminopeptidase
MVTRVKTKAEIAAMRESGRMLAAVLDKLRRELKPGMSTMDLNDIAAKELASIGGEPAFKGYQGFPAVLCVSVNDQVVHGIPNKEKIVKEGDIVGLDFGVKYKGMITDAAISMIAGKPKTQGHIRLVDRTEKALQAGIGAVHDRVRTGDIGSAVQGFLKPYNYGIVRDLVGHGVGHDVHEDPNIPNYGQADSGPWLDKGMTIAIEPMVTLGTERVYVAPEILTGL